MIKKIKHPENQLKNPNVVFFHVPPIDHTQIIQIIKHKLENQISTWILTLNWHMVSKCFTSKNYLNLILEADLVCADGQPIVWLSKFSKPKLNTTIIGYYLTEEILKVFNDIPIAIIGGTNKEKISNYLTVLGHKNIFLWTDKYDGSAKQKDFLYNQLIANKIQIVFVGLGVPKQDDFCAYLKSHKYSGVFIGVGGSFDILTSQMRKIPIWAHKNGLAWFFRLIRDPRHLLIRYLAFYPIGLILFLLNLATSIFKKKHDPFNS